MHNSPSKLANWYKIGITSGVKYTMVPVYLNLMDSKLDGNMFHSITLILMQFALLLTTQLQPNSTDLPNIFPLWFGGPNIFSPLQPVPTLYNNVCPSCMMHAQAMPRTTPHCRNHLWEDIIWAWAAEKGEGDRPREGNSKGWMNGGLSSLLRSWLLLWQI